MRHFAQGAADIIERAGRTVTYRKLSPDSTYSAATGKLTPTYEDYTVKAGVRNYTPKEITGLINYGDREVRLKGLDLPFTPAEGDTVVIGAQSFRVSSINTLAAGDEEALHIMHVQGQ